MQALTISALLALLPLLASANPVLVEKRWTAAPIAGSQTQDAYPPTGTQVDTAQFPRESQVGYPGITRTGVEPAAIQTAPAYPYNEDSAARWPLLVDQPNDLPDVPHTPDSLTSSSSSCNSGSGSGSGSDFDITRYWGNLSPWYSVSSDTYGLPDASPAAPSGCSITQTHILYRHGARYPTDDAAPPVFAAKVANATKQPGGFGAEGELAFLNDWTYKLGAEYLTPFGRLQEFELGLGFRQQYGYLLNNFTAQGKLPVFRTESQDRMVKTAQNFAAGFFGVPEFLDQVNLLITVETRGINNTGASYETCTNSNDRSKGYIGATVADAYAVHAFNSTLSRLNSLVHGITFTSVDLTSMMQLCAYETVALGYSSFCHLFTQEDFENFEYYYDLMFYYSQGPGSPVAAAQGKGWAEELLARFKHQYITSSDSTVNSTLTDNPTYFPLDQSIYADATHEVIVMDIITALNLTNVYKGGPLDLYDREKSEGSKFRANRIVPFATHLVTQVMECEDTSSSKQVRFIVNDAVVPLSGSYSGCPDDKHGRCAFDTVVQNLEARLAEIDFDYDCFGNYTAEAGHDYNGRAPR